MNAGRPLDSPWVKPLTAPLSPAVTVVHLSVEEVRLRGTLVIRRTLPATWSASR